MLRNFAFGLLAATLVAGPGFAAQPSGSAGSTPPAAAAAASAAPTTAPQIVNSRTHQTKPTKTVKRMRSHFRKHVARGKHGTMKLSRHVEFAKHHRHHIAHLAKPGKVSNVAKSAKTAKPATQSAGR